MSDVADRAEWRIAKDLENAMAHVRKMPQLVADGHCHYCDEDVDKLRKALKESKGPGNFRNVFMYAPNGKKDGIQILPVSEVAAKDEFFNIKGVTRDDVLAAHRVPPQLLGIMPNNTGGFGAVEPAARVFARNELVPLQAQFLAINEWLGVEVVKFNDYELAIGGEVAQ